MLDLLSHRDFVTSVVMRKDSPINWDFFNSSRFSRYERVAFLASELWGPINFAKLPIAHDFGRGWELSEFIIKTLNDL